MALSISHRCMNIAPSLTLQIDTRAKEMAASGVNVIGFGAGEPDFPTPQHICDAAKEALDKGMTRYTAVPGTMELRMAITRKMERDHGLTYSPQEILVSNGAKHSLFTIFQTILDPGDEVLIPTPCWVSYPELVRMAGGVPVFIPTNEENRFIPSNRDIASRVTRRTKAIILTSPSNPNGSVWSREQLQFVGNLAVTHPFYIVSDEIYEKLIYDGRKHLSIRCACPAAEPGIHWNGPCHPVRGRIEDRDAFTSRTECLQRLHRSMHGFSLDREQVLSCLLIDFRNG